MTHTEKNTSPLLTYVVFDGQFFGVGEAFNTDKEVEPMIEFNPSIAILSEGYGVTRKDIEGLFINNIVRIAKKLTWFKLDNNAGQLLLDIVADEIKIANVTIEGND